MESILTSQKYELTETEKFILQVVRSNTGTIRGKRKFIQMVYNINQRIEDRIIKDFTENGEGKLYSEELLDSFEKLVRKDLITEERRGSEIHISITDNGEMCLQKNGRCSQRDSKERLNNKNNSRSGRIRSFVRKIGNAGQYL